MQAVGSSGCFAKQCRQAGVWLICRKVLDMANIQLRSCRLSVLFVKQGR